MHLVLDADQLVYSCGFASQGEPLAYTLQTVKNALANIKEETGAATCEIFISGEGNFRKEIATSAGYKATRSGDKPPTYDDIREYLITRYEATTVDKMEADDAVSIILWEDFVTSGGDPDNAGVILSSPDKDLKNTPGWHHNPKTGQIFWVTLNQAERHFWYQMVMGDSVDNIPGIPELPVEWHTRKGIRKPPKGCGAATAKALLGQSATAFDAGADVVDAYLAWGRSRGMSEPQTLEYLCEQGTLLWMTRELDELGDPVLFQLSEDILYEGRRRHEESYFDARIPGEEAEGPGNRAEETVRADLDEGNEEQRVSSPDSVLGEGTGASDNGGLRDDNADVTASSEGDHGFFV